MDRERAILTYSVTHRETNEDILAPLPHKIQAHVFEMKRLTK